MAEAESGEPPGSIETERREAAILLQKIARGRLARRRRAASLRARARWRVARGKFRIRRAVENADLGGVVGAIRRDEYRWLSDMNPDEAIAQLRKVDSVSSEKASVMVSYCRRNLDVVSRLHARLKSGGRAVWIDWESIPKGVDWWVSIKDGIDAAHACIVCLSSEFLLSQVCGEEVEYMLKKSKRVLPIVVKDDFDFVDVVPALSKLNFVFLRTDTATGSIEDVSMREISAALDTDHAYLEFHTRFARFAEEWQRHGRDPGLLLLGKYLRVVHEFVAKAKTVKHPQPTEVMYSFFAASLKHQNHQSRKLQLLRAMHQSQRGYARASGARSRVSPATLHNNHHIGTSTQLLPLEKGSGALSEAGASDVALLQERRLAREAAACEIDAALLRGDNAGSGCGSARLHRRLTAARPVCDPFPA